jgi:hypothetical protein
MPLKSRLMAITGDNTWPKAAHGESVTILDAKTNEWEEGKANGITTIHPDGGGYYVAKNHCCKVNPLRKGSICMACAAFGTVKTLEENLKKVEEAEYGEVL